MRIYLEHDINLNIHYTAPGEVWDEIGEPEDGYEFIYYG